MSKYHELKTWPAFFKAVIDGDKTFEVRKNDRDFQVGEHLWLLEWNPDTGEYTGRKCWIQISYKLDGGQFGVEPGYCVLGLRKGDPRDPDWWAAYHADYEQEDADANPNP